MFRAVLTLLLFTSLIIISGSAVACVGPTTPERMQSWREAAETGDAKAQAFLAAELIGGSCSKHDYVEGEKWARRAAEQGNSSGQFSLGSLYADGNGLKQDYPAAYFWFALSVKSSNSEYLANFTAGFRDDAAKHLTPEQKAAADKKVEDWHPPHAVAVPAKRP